MAVVRYRCDTCNREIDILRNKKGLEAFGRCNITNGCKGKLKYQDVLPNFLIGNLPSDVENLTNWIPRQVLYTHDQTVKRKEWVVVHNLATEPSVQVYINDGSSLVETEPLAIITIDKNTTKIVFSQAYSGVVQCIARSTGVVQPELKSKTLDSETFVQTSIASSIIFATEDDLTSANVRIHWKDSKSNYLGYVDQPVEANSTALPWGDYTKVLYKGKQLTIYVIDIIPPVGVDNGSHVYFDTDGGAYQPNKAIVLYANYPFSKFDIVKNKIFFMDSLDQTSTILYSSYQNGELLIGGSKVKSIYPALRTL